MEHKQIQMDFKPQSSYQWNEDGMIHKNKQKKRIAVDSWSFTFDPDQLSSEKQLELLKHLSPPSQDSLQESATQQIQKRMLQEIKKKIYNYKQQDIHKKIWNADQFITLETILERLIACNLICYYCNKEMHVLYDIQRQSSQWSVDRIDNTLGHNINNIYIACLECNLKRRCRSDSKFLSTKQMVLVKR